MILISKIRHCFNSKHWKVKHEAKKTKILSMLLILGIRLAILCPQEEKDGRHDHMIDYAFLNVTIAATLFIVIIPRFDKKVLNFIKLRQNLFIISCFSHNLCTVLFYIRLKYIWLKTEKASPHEVISRLGGTMQEGNK